MQGSSKNRNENIQHLFDNINAQSFGWLKTKHNNLVFDCLMWLLNPFNFL